MLRILVAFMAALACSAAAAQNFAGTFTTANAQGGVVTLTLQQDGQKVKGTFAGNKSTFDVQGEVTPHGLMGSVTGPESNLYMMAQFEGENLVLVLVPPGPTGQANPHSAHRIIFVRSAPGSAKP